MPAQTGNPKNCRCIGGMTPGAAGRALREMLGYEGSRPGHEAVTAALLDGCHALTVMPTGSRKWLGFKIPVLVMERLAVVVAPVRADVGRGVRAQNGGRCGFQDIGLQVYSITPSIISFATLGDGHRSVSALNTRW